MRTIQLTHDEIQLLLNALGIAEAKYNELIENYLKQVGHVRGASINEAQKESEFMFEKANKFADLFYQIENGYKDI